MERQIVRMEPTKVKDVTWHNVPIKMDSARMVVRIHQVAHSVFVHPVKNWDLIISLVQTSMNVTRLVYVHKFVPTPKVPTFVDVQTVTF